MTRLEPLSYHPTWDRVGRYVASTGWAHLVLICGVCLFLFPFVWMLGMSLKTDEEATTTDLFPSVPVFLADSPVVRHEVAVPKPQSLSDRDWKTLLPFLREQAMDRLQQSPLPAGAEFVDTARLREAAVSTLISQAIDRLPESTWSLPRASLLAACQTEWGDDDLKAALEAHLGRLTFRSLQIRTLDAKIYNIFSGTDCAKRWKVDSGNAVLCVANQSAFLRYHFNSPSDEPIVISTHFTFPADPRQLHKVIVSMTNDDSWHQLNAELVVGNQRWVSGLTTYIAQYRPGSLILQPPTFDDTTSQPHTWVPLQPMQTTSKAASLNAVLTLTIRPSGTVQAILGKVARNYQRAFRSVPFWTYIGNSLLLVGLQMGGALFSAAFVAYAFARLNWPGRSVAFALLLSTMMLPSQVTMIPSFVIWKSLGWYNTLNPLWVGSWFGSAFFIFLMVQNMKTIPRELEEAARIDGLNALQTWWYIILPLVKPTLAAIAIMVFMGAWNDFMGPLIMLRDQARFPLSLGLFGMKVDQGTDFTLIMAGNMLMTFPVIVIFFLFQRYFIEGVTVSGMKG